MTAPRQPGIAHRPLTRAQQQVRRAECLVRIPALLEHGRKTATEVGQLLGVHPSTAFSYLHHMAHELHTVRKSAETRGSSALWELGADPVLVAASNKPDAGGAPRRCNVPARQVGMWRDWLVAALYGPAARGALP